MNFSPLGVGALAPTFPHLPFPGLSRCLRPAFFGGNLEDSCLPPPRSVLCRRTMRLSRAFEGSRRLGSAFSVPCLPDASEGSASGLLLCSPPAVVCLDLKKPSSSQYAGEASALIFIVASQSFCGLRKLRRFGSARTLDEHYAVVAIAADGLGRISAEPKDRSPSDVPKALILFDREVT